MLTKYHGGNEACPTTLGDLEGVEDVTHDVFREGGVDSCLGRRHWRVGSSVARSHSLSTYVMVYRGEVAEGFSAGEADDRDEHDLVARQ